MAMQVKCKEQNASYKIRRIGNAWDAALTTLSIGLWDLFGERLRPSDHHGRRFSWKDASWLSANADIPGLSENFLGLGLEHLQWEICLQ